MSVNNTNKEYNCILKKNLINELTTILNKENEKILMNEDIKINNNKNIAILSLAIGEKYKSYVDYGIKSKEEYCKRNNYTFIQDESVYDTNRHPAWSKILLIQKYLKNFDYIVWLDADTLIMNMEKRLEDFIFLFKENTEFMYTYDCGSEMNTGVWFIKNTEYAHHILKEIYKQDDLNFTPLWEQDAFKRLYNNNYKDLKKHCTIIPIEYRRLFNSTVYEYKYNNFLIHLMGIREPENIVKIMSDNYPLQKEYETDIMYQDRINWIKNKYS